MRESPALGWWKDPKTAIQCYRQRDIGRMRQRVFYVAKFAEGIYVLHAFRKKTQRTRKTDIEIGRQRLRELNRHRRTRDRESPNANQD